MAAANDTKEKAIKNLRQIPGVGVSIAGDLWDIGIKNIDELKGKDPEKLYEVSNRLVGAVQDRCLLYVFRCAVYYAQTPVADRDPVKLRWWYWKNNS